jgi:AbrB family looped-hinge helix DNA binding protein
MASVTLSSKFQLSIPKAVREEMHLQAGWMRCGAY